MKASVQARKMAHATLTTALAITPQHDRKFHKHAGLRLGVWGRMNHTAMPFAAPMFEATIRASIAVSRLGWWSSRVV